MKPLLVTTVIYFSGTITFLSLLFISGCSDKTVVSPFQEVTLQVPITIITNSFGPLPKTNTDKVILSESLVYEGSNIISIELYQMSFMFLDLSAQVAQHNTAPVNIASMQSSLIRFSFRIDGESSEYVAAVFPNAVLRDYIRVPQPIEISSEVSAAIGRALKERRTVTIISYYGALTSSGGTPYFTRINSQIDIVCRVRVRLQ